MKAILVIDMPTNCRGCDKLVRKGCLKGDYRKDERPKQCPLKPLPKGHGRLGDLDALEKEMIGGIKKSNYEEGYEEFTPINNVDDCVQCVRFADTIIEADKGEE